MGLHHSSAIAAVCGVRNQYSIVLRSDIERDWTGLAEQLLPETSVRSGWSQTFCMPPDVYLGVS